MSATQETTVELTTATDKPSISEVLKNKAFMILFSAQFIENIGRAIEIMADAEGLYAHKNAITLRLKSIN